MPKTAKGLMLAIACLCGAMDTSQAADRALIIGVGQYASAMDNLPGIQLDVDMARQIASRLGFVAQHTHVIQDQQATLQSLRRELQQLVDQAQPNDRILIYFSGHGSHAADTNDDESDGLDETLELHDGSFTDDELSEWLSKINSENVMIMIDACHSGTATKSLGANRYVMAQGRVKARNLKQPSLSEGLASKDLGIEYTQGNDGHYVAIGAAQDHQQALATLEGSLFTKALLDSLEEVRNRQPETSLKALFDLTAAKIAEVTNSFSPSLTGSATLAQKSIQFADVSASTGQNMLWKETVSAVHNAATPLTIRAVSSLKEGELFEFEVDVPKSGYLNVVTVGPTDNATVLFPTPKVTDNRVHAQTVKVPTGGMVIRARAPLGKTLVAVFLTEQAIDLQKSALGNRDVRGVLTGLGRTTVSAMRAFGREPQQKTTEGQKPQYAAGMHEINIVAR